MKRVIEIAGKKVGHDNPTYFIADVAANHDGDLGRAKELIYLAAEAGADAAKFQHFEASTIVSDRSFKAMGQQLSHQSTWKKSVYEVYQDASVSINWTEELKNTCRDAGIPFFTTPYSLERVNELDEHVPAFKIGSGDITWKDMVELIASKGKPYILASGASTFDEVVRAVKWGTSINDEFCLMQCNTNYTASLDNFRFIQLNVLKSYRAMYPELVLGLSDHTPGHATVLGAVALGAKMIEKHFTDNTKREGPDHKFSMDPRAWREMVDRTRELELALGCGIKKIEENEEQTVIVQRRSLHAARDLIKGQVISKSDLVPLRPAPQDAVDPSMHDLLSGKTVTRDLKAGEYIRLSDIHE